MAIASETSLEKPNEKHARQIERHLMEAEGKRAQSLPQGWGHGNEKSGEDTYRL
jgi:hypothetical protein